MSVHEEIKEQQKKLKGQGFKAHWDYFWEYYKIHTVVAIAVIVFLAVLIHDVTNSKPYGFYAMLVNSSASAAQDTLESEFVEYGQIDTENYDCLIDTSSSYNLQIIDEATIATSQKIMAIIAAGELDVMVIDLDLFTNYANQQTFCDLREVLSAEQVAKYQDKFFYVDQAYIDYLNSDEYQNYIATGEFDETNKYAVMADNYNRDFTLPNTDPDEMENPIPVGIIMEDSPVLERVGAYNGLTPILGIVVNTGKPELATEFVEYLQP